jgi:alcohol dehydrogenase (NADP+)
MNTIGYAAAEAGGALAPFRFARRAPRADDVAMEILYSGVCHSDLHMVRNDWGNSAYPLVPGHEIVGRVTAVGPDVTRFAVGDAVGVGCMVDSCGTCDQCRKGEEQFCRAGMTMTYGDRDRISGEPTFGGYSKHLLVREAFALRIPASLDLSRTAPLLCAGITTWSPLHTFGAGPGRRVGVIGLGGLGHMAVKLAHAMGAHVRVISRSPAKTADAMALGADGVLVSSDADAMAKAASSFDLIIDTVPVVHDVNAYVPLLDIDATMAMVGYLGPLEAPSTVPMVMGRRRIAGSLIGGIRQTQEMLDFCSRKGVLPDCETIRMDEIGTAFGRMERSDVRYRFVIDMASLPVPSDAGF